VPRQKPWMPRLPLIIEALQVSTVEWFLRSDVEKLFACKPTAARDLMAIAGKSDPGPGMEARVSRQNLLWYVTHSSEAQDAMQELARRKRLAETLNQAALDNKLRRVQIPATAGDKYALLRDVSSVSLKPGKLEVVFTDARDLVHQLFRFTMAVGNEWDGFEKLCEETKGMSEDAKELR
jgi:hypothetical protein